MIIENGEKKGVKLNNIVRTCEDPNKKFKVDVRDPATKKIKVVRFGDPNVEKRRSDREKFEPDMVPTVMDQKLKQGI